MSIEKPTRDELLKLMHCIVPYDINGNTFLGPVPVLFSLYLLFCRIPLRSQVVHVAELPKIVAVWSADCDFDKFTVSTKRYK